LVPLCKFIEHLGLRRAGPHPTRQTLLTAMAAMREVDLGGVTVNYTPASHDGSRFVELVVVGKNGAIWR
jgi:branched-chain amino acid transport system substrate-binding protein